MRKRGLLHLDIYNFFLFIYLIYLETLIHTDSNNPFVWTKLSPCVGDTHVCANRFASMRTELRLYGRDTPWSH
jgi:hypothetical protein